MLDWWVGGCNDSNLNALPTTYMGYFDSMECSFHILRSPLLVSMVSISVSNDHKSLVASNPQKVTITRNGSRGFVLCHLCTKNVWRKVIQITIPHQKRGNLKHNGSWSFLFFDRPLCHCSYDFKNVSINITDKNSKSY